MKYSKKAYAPPKSFKRFYINPSPDMLPDGDIPEENKFLITRNKIKWNTWMNVLAGCQRHEEESPLKEIETLNEELRRLIINK